MPPRNAVWGALNKKPLAKVLTGPKANGLAVPVGTSNCISAKEMHSKSRRSLATYTGSIWPSSDFSVGRAVPPKSDGAEHPLGGVFRDESGYFRDIARTEGEWHPEAALDTAQRMMDWADACGDEPVRSRRLASAALEMAKHAEDGTVPQCDRRDYLREAGAPGSLGLSAVINSRSLRKQPGRKAGKPAARRGSKGFGTYGKRMTRSGTGLLDEHYGRRCLTFGTATLPPCSDEEHKLIALNWAKIQNRFMEKICRKLRRCGLKPEYVVVTEIQEKRWERWGQCGLHLHWVCPGKANPWSHWAISPSEVARMWGETLAAVVGHPVDASKATRVEVPRKGLMGELSKYMSKGCKVVKAVVDAGRGDELPTAWWGMSRDLKREVKSKTERFSSDVAEWLIDNADILRRKKLVWFRHIYVTFDVNHETGEIDRRWVGMTGSFLTKVARQKVMNWARQGINLSEDNRAVS